MNQKNIGIKIRTLRKSHGISMSKFADSVGKTKSYISMIENGKALPSLPTLKTMTSYFGLTLAEFFENDEQKSHINQEVFKFNEDARQIYAKKDDYGLYLLINNTHLKMKTYIVELSSKGGYSQEIKHEGEEMGYVLEGSIELTVDGKSSILTKGDYFYFYSDKKHKVNNLFEETARILWVYLPG